MENADFDKFIKSNSRKNLDVPDGLDWENMNIPLPPKKKDRKFFFILWFGLLFLVSSVLIYLNMDKSSTDLASKNLSPIENGKTNTNINFEAIEKIEIPETPSNSTLKTIQSKKIINTHPIFSSSNNIGEDLKPLSDFKFESFILVDSTNEKALGVKNQMPIHASESSISKSQVHQLNLVGIQSMYSLIELPFEKRKELSIPTYFTPPTTNLKDNKLSLSLSFGLNTFQSNYRSGNQINLLKSAENQAIGTAYNLGLQYQLNKGFFAGFGISYQNLHHTFSYSEELDPVIDFTQFQKINRTKRVFYNNYFQFLELNIGGGKSFPLGKNWGSQFTLNINPSFKIKSSGRTLNDQESIIDIENFSSDQKLFISASAEVRLFYTIKSNQIFTSVGYKHTMSNIKLLNNSALTLQPQIINVNFGVSRKF